MPMINRLRLALFCLLCSAGPAAFLCAERWYGLWGFPLDDAWIHQTYARSLAALQGWSYAGGPASAGSTSPAWTMLQIPIYWLHLPAVLWGYGLGIALFGAVIYLTFRITHYWEPKIAWLAALLVAWEWHLVWASLSGMETLLFAAWILLVWWICLDRPKLAIPGDVILYGAILGLGIWIRPEAILVSGSAGIWLLWRYGVVRDGRRIAGFVLGATVFCGLYFLHMYLLNGRLWPNTMYAKPLEFASLRAVDIFSRTWTSVRAIDAGSLSSVSWFGVVWCVRLVRTRRWGELIPLLWAGMHLGAYAIQLPVIYQHARYDIPIIPVVMIYGLVGFYEVRQWFPPGMLQRLFYRAGMGTILAVSLVFLAIGANQYALDVGVIETEMVSVAKWIHLNTPEHARIAAHDVGALGYWGGRAIVDMGGLTDESAWSLLEGNENVETYLEREAVDYWMTFPSVYSPFTDKCHPIFQTLAPFASLFQEAGMALYKWPEGCSSRS
jgi:hypothetical protein